MVVVCKMSLTIFLLNWDEVDASRSTQFSNWRLPADVNGAHKFVCYGSSTYQIPEVPTKRERTSCWALTD